MVTAQHKPSFGFYYLGDQHASPVGHVKGRQLAFDIQRGVKRLPEYAYIDSWGSTQSSMRFMNALRNVINVDLANRAELRYSQRDHFTLMVWTKDGFELVFKGVSGGYHGEGTRGCYDILKVCGFNEAQCQKVWTNETFTVIKRSK
jgi:hypothetical protein